ncbi:MAG: copper chaperone PCu(A)C [Gammaproteobacteria bacterium]|nr:copper chaperone PCu(A)C [Gammaproteobacteria bacterium]
MKIVFNKFVFIFVIFLFASSTYAVNKDEFHIHDPWIREAPPVAKVLAAYMVIGNHSDKPFTITTIISPMFKKVEIHESKIEDGIAKMQQIPELVIDPQQDLALSPGGNHLMLFEPNKILKHGDLVPLKFILSSGDSFSANAKVKKMVGSMKSMSDKKDGKKDGNEHEHRHDH